MSHAVRNTLRRLGFVSMLLLALALAMPAAQACEPIREGSSIIALATAPDACPIGDCQDCGIVCADGCCHAPAPGLLSSTTTGIPDVRFEAPTGWADILGAPLGERSGLRRPPRA